MRQQLVKLRDEGCPKCGHQPLDFQDDLDLDLATRTWRCEGCGKNGKVPGMPLSWWPTTLQEQWYAKAANQRARSQNPVSKLRQ